MPLCFVHVGFSCGASVFVGEVWDGGGPPVRDRGGKVLLQLCLYMCVVWRWSARLHATALPTHVNWVAGPRLPSAHGNAAIILSVLGGKIHTHSLRRAGNKGVLQILSDLTGIYLLWLGIEEAAQAELSSCVGATTCFSRIQMSHTGMPDMAADMKAGGATHWQSQDRLQT